MNEVIKPLDHGILNIPLAKRGNIDAELDKYKTEQKRIDEDRRFLVKQANQARTQPALDAYKALSRDAVKLYAKRAAISMTDARNELKALAECNPGKAQRVFQALEELVLKGVSA